MRRSLLVGLVLIASVLAVEARAGSPPRRDACLQNLRRGPDSFLEYLCLGTPGLPEHAPEVAATLDDILRRRPGEPHARLYRALMRLYRHELVSRDDFEQPVLALRRRGDPVDIFLAQLAFIEWRCDQTEDVCIGAEPMLADSEALARRIGETSLLRLAAIARIRWSTLVQSSSAGSDAGKALDALPGAPPLWLAVLEASTRAEFEYTMGEYLKVRQRYAHILDITPSDSVAHAAALGGYATATAKLAGEGLLDRSEAVRLLRQALSAQKLLQLSDYHQGDIGTNIAEKTLALLLGPTREARELVNLEVPHPLAIELLLQGDAADRARALDLARALTQRSPTSPSMLTRSLTWPSMLARSHAELTIGSHDDGVLWGRRAIEKAGRFRGRETDEELRIADARFYDNAHKAFANDLLGNEHRLDDDVALAFHVTEQLRASVLLDSLLARTSGPKETIPEAREVQAALGPDEALVSFMVWAPIPTTRVPYTRGVSWAFILTKSALRVVPIPPGTVLEPAVKAWVRLLDSRRPWAAPGAKALYSEVLEPVLRSLPPETRSLILVPDGPLHRLPFDALSETGGPPFLVERYALSVVPSATIRLRLRQRVPSPAGLALAFANTPEGPAVSVAETRGEVEPGLLAPLLHAREEAKEAVEAFPRGSRLFAGSEATPEKLSGPEFAQASLVHFAAHGVVNQQEPRKSFLLLAPGSTASGRLMVSDIQRLDWTGKTVVLAACDTSVGAFRLGEGVLSVARGFFAGGASSVLGTLSQVRDDEQRALFHVFYEELRRGVSVGQAMTAAKRALDRRGAPPAAWANVIVLGDATVRPLAPDAGWPRSAVLAGSVAGLALLALGLRTRSRSRKRAATSA